MTGNYLECEFIVLWNPAAHGTALSGVVNFGFEG
jgi:hypothetical protein